MRYKIHLSAIFDASSPADAAEQMAEKLAGHDPQIIHCKPVVDDPAQPRHDEDFISVPPKR